MELADVKMRANQDACDVIFNEEEKKKEELESLKKKIEEEKFNRKYDN